MLSVSLNKTFPSFLPLTSKVQLWSRAKPHQKATGCFFSLSHKMDFGSGMTVNKPVLSIFKKIIIKNVNQIFLILCPF